jgi:hypothetical protein
MEHEINFYLTKADKPDTKFKVKCDMLEYWKGHEQMIPMLARLAREIFAIPATSAPSEQTFLAAGQIVTESRTLFNTLHDGGTPQNGVL